MRVTGAHVNLFDVFKFTIGRVDLQADNSDEQIYHEGRAAEARNTIDVWAKRGPSAWAQMDRPPPLVIYAADGNEVLLYDRRGQYIDLRI
jgi:hypothetical protein